MIDLHSHILPGLDDGSPDLATSVEMARSAVADGVAIMVATPHVNGRYMPGPAAIRKRVAELNDALAAASVPLVVTLGAEIAISELGALEDDVLSGFALGGSSTLLVESPYLDAVPFFDEVLFSAQSKGFRILLAHPERSPMFQTRLEALRKLVDHGVLCSITAGSLRGRFGRRVRDHAIDMMRLGLVHNVSSDSHNLTKRPPGLSAGFEGAEKMLPGVSALAPWLTEDVPRAVLESTGLPPSPVADWGTSKRGKGGLGGFLRSW